MTFTTPSFSWRIAASVVLTLASAAAQAQGAPAPGSGGATATAAPATGAAASAPQTTGEVRRIDARAKKITLRHGAIKNLDMPPMTMVFQVTDPALLQGLKVGDPVLFDAEQVQGAYRVTRIVPRP